MKRESTNPALEPYLPRPKLTTRRGELTAYALACGYVEVQGNMRLRYVQTDGGGYYTVHGDDKYGTWFEEDFSLLTDARKALKDNA